MTLALCAPICGPGCIWGEDCTGHPVWVVPGLPAPFALGVPYVEFDHHERGWNRTMKFNAGPTVESGG